MFIHFFLFIVFVCLFVCAISIYCIVFYHDLMNYYFITNYFVSVLYVYFSWVFVIFVYVITQIRGLSVQLFKTTPITKDNGTNKVRIKPIRLFRIMSIPTTFRLFLVLTSEEIGRRLPVFTLLL